MKTWDDDNILNKAEFGSIYQEVGNAVTSTGQSLDTGGSTVADPDVQQLARAISYAGGGASTMTTSGGATDPIALAPINTDIKLPSSYALLDGFTARFYITTQRTVAYTININSLGAKSLVKDVSGTTMSIGDIPLNTIVEAVYINSLDKWVLTAPSSLSIYTNKSAVLQYRTTSSSDGATAVANTWTTYPLNNTQYSDINGLALASNEISLPAGTYTLNGWITVDGRFEESATGRLRFASISGGIPTEVFKGMSFFKDAGGNEDPACNILISGTFSTTSTTTYALQYYIPETNHTLGTHVAGDTVNVYGAVNLMRLR